jgi:D-sedoheptulose 7-phosphate isomerase
MITVREYLEESKRVAGNQLSMEQTILNVARVVFDQICNGGTLYWMGNGGSAADCQHLSTELVSRFMTERRAVNSISFTTNTSLLTAISNDYSYAEIFKRQVEAHVKDIDIVFAISTSGRSPNILIAMEEARKRGAKVIGLTGKGTKEFSQLADFVFHISSDITGVIQQGHITIGQALCLQIERHLKGL